MVQNKGIDILEITESWTHEDILDAETNMLGFTLFVKIEQWRGKQEGRGFTLHQGLS